MLIRNRRRARQRAWPWFAAVATAMFLLALTAAPMSAAPSKIQLSAVSVSPRTGTPKTTIVITVMYQSVKGGRAGQMTASIGGTDHTMTRVPGGTWETGVKFRWAGTLPLGTYAVVLKALAQGSALASIAGGTITIKPPPPPPSPPAPATHAPRPKPTTAPSTQTRPAPTQRPVVTLDAVLPTPSPVVPWSEAASSLRQDDSVPPFLIVAGLGGPTDPTGGGPTDPTGGGPTDPGTDVPVKPGVGGGDGGGAGKAWGPLAGLFAAVGITPPALPPLSLGPTLVTTTGAVATAMAFGMFGRRRRDDELNDEDLAAAAATGVGVGPSQLVGSGMPVGMASGVGAALGERPGGDESGALPIAAGVDESLLPRWRRPSLLQARKTDPIRDSTPALRLTFDQGLVGPLAGHERRIIRYRVVRLLDSPDELRGTEIGYLDQGDEVQLLEKQGAYCLVLCPDGQQGWLHKMVLGEIVHGDGVGADAPVATMPTVADSWTMGESDADSDVFAAYLESRRRRGA